MKKFSTLNATSSGGIAATMSRAASRQSQASGRSLPMSLRPTVNTYWLAMFPDAHDRPARHTTQGSLNGNQVISVELVCVLP